MKRALLVLLILGTFYVLRYEQYHFDPCSGNICLAIEGYDVAAKDVICDSLECVEKQLNQSPGTDHLLGVYRIEYWDLMNAHPMIELKKLKVGKKVTVE